MGNYIDLICIELNTPGAHPNAVPPLLFILPSSAICAKICYWIWQFCNKQTQMKTTDILSKHSKPNSYSHQIVDKITQYNLVL